MREKWENFHTEAEKKLKEFIEAGKNWINEFDKMEKTAKGLVMDIQREMKDSSEGAKKVWMKQLREAQLARQKLRANLERRLDAVNRSEEHLKKAIDELTK